MQRYPLVVQLFSLKKAYGPLVESSSVSKGVLTCIINLQPAPDCDIYKVKIKYKQGNFSPKVWLLNPKLERVNDKLPHHIYGHDSAGHPQLCVFYPGYNEWNPQMLISQSLVPWIITWLNTYEYWLITGKWIYAESPHLATKGNSKLGKNHHRSD